MRIKPAAVAGAAVVLTARLEISEKTVKAHLTRVFAVVGVSDRTSAALGPSATASSDASRNRH